METVSWGGTGLSATFELLRIEIQHVIAVVAWALIVGLAAAAGCWCCGYVVRSTWLSAGPPVRRPRPRVTDAGGDLDTLDLRDDDVAREAARGIQEIEEFLAVVGSDRPRRSRPEGGDRSSEA